MHFKILVILCIKLFIAIPLPTYMFTLLRQIQTLLTFQVCKWAKTTEVGGRHQHLKVFMRIQLY